MTQSKYIDSWKVEQKEMKNGLFGRVQIVSTGFVPGDARHSIATVHPNHPRLAENARIIAAAPQMLSACNDALAVLMSLQKENPGRNVDVDASIRKLIAAITSTKIQEKEILI